MVGAYADTIWKASPRVEVVPGFRVDVFTSRLASPSRASAGANDVPGNGPSLDGASEPRGRGGVLSRNRRRPPAAYSAARQVFSSRIDGVNVMPRSSPSGDKNRLTLCPHGSFLFFTSIR